MKKKSIQWIIGIDEAGRGPLAGPLSLGIVAIKRDASRSIFRGIKESKQLTALQRELWFEKLKGICEYAVSLTSHTVIDKEGLSRAVKKAIAKGLQRLNKNPHECQVLLDGLLHAPEEYSNQKTIIGGDASTPIIAAASIMAKVTRDRHMIRLAKKFPAYGFERHKGYGTKAHYLALKKHGACELHRKSFL